MRLIVPLPEFEQAKTVMRHAGYSEHYDRNTKETSYARRLASGFFPKYHAYVEERGTTLSINLHVDQKQASYVGTSKHSGEYDGELVEREVERLRTIFQNVVVE